MKKLRVVLVKPSKYGRDGQVERFRWGFMPNATLPYMRSLTPSFVRGRSTEIHLVDEYVQTELEYLALLHREESCSTLVALVGVQCHQLQRALDLAAYARLHGVSCCVIGGPQVMTCDTTVLQGRGVSFALAEAELVWPAILNDAIDGELCPTYGEDRRWQQTLEAPVLTPPARRELRRYIIPMLGIYPARGCPYKCNFCSVIKIAGQRIRSVPIERTLESLRAAKAAGIRLIMFTSDNFNKYAEAPALLQTMIDERIDIPFFVQCDTQVDHQEELIELLGRAGCWQMFLGVESFDRDTLRDAKKQQNHPERYGDIVALCHKHGIAAHFSNIIGFPADTEAGILQHLRALRHLSPDFASFYVLTPIPGTEQYDDFMADGLITEKNLDRFDATRLVWRHPRLSGGQLAELVFRCYREFYAVAPDLVSKLGRSYHSYGAGLTSLTLGGWVFHRLAGSIKKFHPMEGGVWRVKRDSLGDYIELRRRLFRLELVPLPRSLALSETDRAFNQGEGKSAGQARISAREP